MSELVQQNDSRAAIRWKLLTGVSVLALTVSSIGLAKAEDAAQPQIWIELGGQLSRLDEGQETFAPVFPNSPPRPSIFSPSQKFETLPLYSIDETGKISFQPDGSNWVLSASVRYGRSSSNRNARQQTQPPLLYVTKSGHPVQSIGHGTAYAARFADTNVQNSEHHLIADFQAGKDVGLGMFGGKDGSSVLNFGVRFAQFSTKSNIALQSDPDWHFSNKYLFGYEVPEYVAFHSNAAGLRAMRSFHGIGPSLSWNASAPIAGRSKDGELTFDWGVNAAILFGRQRVKMHHQTTGAYRPRGFGNAVIPRYVTYQPPPVDIRRTRTVTVPNVGGFAGLSYRMEDFKVSFGYRADFFFNAMDGGIDAAKKENTGFYGPFASVSVGIGD